MKSLFAVLGIALSLSLTITPRAIAQRNEAGLIAAWEAEQKSDPRTTKFEKVADKNYHFATTRFPYDGDLQVVDVDIRSPLNTGNEDFSFSPGVIGVRLSGASDDFLKAHEASYTDWDSTNTLYWDQKAGAWLTSTQYFESVRRRSHVTASGGSLLAFGYSGFFLILMVVLLVLLGFNQVRMRKLSKRSERSIQLAERNSVLQEENHKIFREILEILKQRSS